MKLKLDENLDPRLAEGLILTGHEVSTVLQENLSGSRDPVLWERCQKERRCLVTLDKGFANVLAYPTSDSPGIVLLRPERQVLTLIGQLFHQLARHLAHESPTGALWIVESGRIRVHRSERD